MALLRAKEIADFTDGAPEGVDGPDGAGSQKGLQLCQSHLDRIRGRGYQGGRNKSQAPMARTACSAAALFLGRQIVQDDDDRPA